MIHRQQIKQLQQEIQELTKKTEQLEREFGLGHEEIAANYRKMLDERLALLKQLKALKKSA